MTRRRALLEWLNCEHIVNVYKYCAISRDGPVANIILSLSIASSQFIRALSICRPPDRSNRAILWARNKVRELFEETSLSERGFNREVGVVRVKTNLQNKSNGSPNQLEARNFSKPSYCWKQGANEAVKAVEMIWTPFVG